MYSKKRKTSYLELNYHREDEEEEDEWEREASSSSRLDLFNFKTILFTD
jgi:hypothetical protein